ncbi:MAG: hypothetical protein M1830_000856 [Pleopsidium flavum]|nr:MAG: hypothetical protein M1830_000856 [Pleopsidium flavum]
MEGHTHTPDLDWISCMEQGVEVGTDLDVAQRMPSSSQGAFDFVDYNLGHQTSTQFVLEKQAGYHVQSSVCPDGIPDAAAGDPPLQYPPRDSIGFGAEGSTTPSLESGCRVIEAKEPRSRRQRSRRTFGRVADLERHYAEQHLRSTIYDCTASGCLSRGEKGFARADKLRLHVSTCHNENTPFFCPSPPCHAGPFTPDLLEIHVANHKHDTFSRYTPFWQIFRPLFGNYFGGANQCPIEGCGRYIQYHKSLLDHDLDTRNRNMSAIVTAGFNATTGLRSCPICNADLELAYVSEFNKKHFVNHEQEFGSLYAYRREIFKAWLGFANDKVFDDVLPAVGYLDRSRIEIRVT